MQFTKARRALCFYIADRECSFKLRQQDGVCQHNSTSKSHLEGESAILTAFLQIL
jgi:hypothetical protein